MSSSSSNRSSVVSLFAFSIFVLAALACQADPVGIVDISAEDFLSQPPANATILDVRTPEEFARGHVPNATLIPHSELAERIAELGTEKDNPVVVYCQSGKRAGMAGNILVEAGFTNVMHLDGDMKGWRANNRPMER